jgi:hypothetical protein
VCKGRGKGHGKQEPDSGKKRRSLLLQADKKKSGLGQRVSEH